LVVIVVEQFLKCLVNHDAMRAAKFTVMLECGNDRPPANLQCLMDAL
jgi:hypothetical protein